MDSKASHSQSTSFSPHAAGLPHITRQDRVLLRGGAQWLIHACGSELHGYQLRRVGDNVEAECCWRVKLSGAVSELAESRYGIVVACHQENNTDLWRVAEGQAHHVASLKGHVTSLVCLGRSAFAIVTNTGHAFATLTEVDLYRQAITSEQPLDSSQMELSSDVTGTHLGLYYLDQRTFYVRNPKALEPCAGGASDGASTSPERPTPTGQSTPDSGDECCHCRISTGTQPPASRPTPVNPTPPRSGPSGPCQPSDGGGVPTPGGGSVTGNCGRVGQNPSGGGGQNPCVADLGWRTRTIAAAGANFVAADATGRNFAVLSGTDMRILDSRQFARSGAMVLTDPTSPMILLQHNATKTWEVLHTDTLLSKLGALDRVPLINPADQGKTFTGMQTMSLMTPHANSTGTIQILILPVLEAGQTFNTSDFAKFGGYMERTAFSHIRDYYFENSFGLLKDIRYQIYGLDTGPKGGPLQLPKLVTDYFYPAYDPARIELTKSGLTFPVTLVFDGRESMVVTAKAANGGRAAKTVTFKFPALLVAKSQQFFPAQIKYAGTETATIAVLPPSPTAPPSKKPKPTTLSLKFPAKDIEMKTEADIPAALVDLANYLDGVFAAAETAAGFPTRLFTKPVVRRVKQPGMDFGFITAYFNHTTTAGVKLDITSVTASAGSDPLGFQNPSTGHSVMDGANSTILQSYLQWVQVLAEEDAGIDFSERYLADVTVAYKGNSFITGISISNQDGGPGAAVNLVSSTGLGDLFDTSASIPNSDTNLDNALAMRDFHQIIDDAFTDAVNRQLPPNPNFDNLLDGINNYFNQFDSIVIGQIGVANTDPGNPQNAQASEAWTASKPKHDFLRSVDGWSTGQFAPYKKIQAQKPWNFTFFDSPPDFPTMCHELGHALGYRDLYSAKDFRQDLAYMGDWSIMDSQGNLAHHCAYHKWESGWIPPDRVLAIPPTEPNKPTDTEVLLVPVEYWNDALVKKAQTQFAKPNMPVVQIVELELGGDNAIVDRVEARQKGVQFSQKLALSPGILITNALQPWDDTRYVSTDTSSGDERYRREVQLLNPSNILQNPGDSFDLAKAPALPAKGIVVTVVDRKEIDGISVFHMKVHRENTAFIDLYFTKGDPYYYKSPDLWVDWTGDNGKDGKSSSTNPADAHIYPPGQPTDQGEQVHVPNTGTEWHWMIARVRNGGQVDAVSVKLDFQVCIPPGGGDKSKNFQTVNSVSGITVPGGNVPVPVLSQWDVPAGFGGHVCLLVDIADYSITHDSDGSALGSADVNIANNWAQKNVDQYVPVSHSPYDPVEFDFSLHNAGWHSEIAYLEPQNLPYGMQLTVTPARQTIPPKATVLFRCKLALDNQILDAGCQSDREFHIVAWRVEGHTAVRWGGVAYKVKPRKATTTTLTGYWNSDGSIHLSGGVSADPGGGVIHVRIAFAGIAARWQAATIAAGGTFTLTVTAPAGSTELDSMALYEGSAMMGPSRSPTLKLNPPEIIK